MKTYLLPFLAVIIGVVFTTLIKKQHKGFIKLLLSFSGAFLLALTFFNLLPEVYHHLDAKRTGLFIMAGILLQVILEYLSKGAEHGHIHISKTNTQFPWLLFISLCIHSFMEGFPIHQHTDMVYGVLIHKIPIAMLITTFLIQSQFKKWYLVLFLSCFAIMTPLGTFVSYSIALSETAVSAINAVVIGIFFHISTIILFESDEGHTFSITKLFAILSGVAIAYLI